MNPLILPFEHPMVAPAPLGFRGGIVLDNDEDVLLRHLRFGKPVDTFPPHAEPTEYLAGSYCYAGMLYNHFGHSMSEMVHRIIPSKRISDCPKWIMVSHRSNKDIKFTQSYSSVWSIYNFLGINSENVTIISRASHVEELDVYQAGSHFGRPPTDDYLDMLEEFTNPRLDAIFKNTWRPEKVYVSKSGSGPTAGLLGEKYLEACFEEAGYFILRPEKYEFAEQLDFYRKSKEIVFLEGSSCHGTEFLGRGSIENCGVISRRPYHVSIFSTAMVPRCNNFSVLKNTVFLGSSVASPETDNIMLHMGTSVLPPGSIKIFLDNNGFSGLKSYDDKKYFEAAKVDLVDYLIKHRNFSNRTYYAASISGMLEKMFEIENS
jgi:hypothetical protein